MFPSSFSARLTWFFVIIVILPMVAVSVVLFRLVADSERGKSDARLSQAQTAAAGLYRDEEGRAALAGRRIGESEALAAAIESGDPVRIRAELEAQAERLNVARVHLELPGGASYETSDLRVLAPSTTTLVDTEGDRAGTLRVSAETVQGYVRDVRLVTGMHAAVVGPGGTIASTLQGLDATELPDRGERELGDSTYRLAAFTAPGWNPEERLDVHLLFDQEGTGGAITSNSLAVAGLLVAFLLLAFAFALTVSRALQSQIQRLLQAARRLGGGDLDVKVPTEGVDEFAALGTEFNAMARQLESRLDELESERARLQEAIRRVGESFAQSLDREALLEIVVRTAVDGVAASVGRASVREGPGGPLRERTRVGEGNGSFDKVLDAVEAAVLEGREAAEVKRGDRYALSHPLRSSESGNKVLGLVSVARGVRAFSTAERDLFNYLANQAAVSIQNVDLHESAQRQAVTDELTGLFNHRRFQEVMSSEVERAKRFGQTLGLVMLDIDDFKLINDRYGHLQGDQVLREVARVLLDTAREIDEPARYGGEEMAVALPQTDLDGAYQFAERLRRRIEALRVPMVSGSGTVRVTASFGAAALPESASTDKDALVAAADSALYRAKRLGKNRTVQAG